MPLRYKYIILGLAALLTACAATTPTPEAPPSIENFTTEGKPTKTVQTPWGDKQVYDPVQDPEVIAAFNYVYQELPKQLKTLDGDSDVFGSEVEQNFTNYAKRFELIRNIQDNDLLRVGCSHSINTYSCDFEEREAKTSIPRYCTQVSFGSATLNECEKQNSSWIMKDVIALSQSPCVKDLRGKDYALMSFWQIGMKNNPRTQTINDKNLPIGKNAQIKSFFLSECRAFDEM